MSISTYTKERSKYKKKLWGVLTIKRFCNTTMSLFPFIFPCSPMKTAFSELKKPFSKRDRIYIANSFYCCNNYNIAKLAVSTKRPCSERPDSKRAPKNDPKAKQHVTTQAMKISLPSLWDMTLFAMHLKNTSASQVDSKSLYQNPNSFAFSN